jgi:hypothetical protein
MQLPVTSSPISVTDSEDGLLSEHLVLASCNAEENRFTMSHYDDISEATPMNIQPRIKSIHFNPEVDVRFIRPRSNTMRSTTSDVSGGSYTYPVSPIGEDGKMQLNDISSPVSDDDEFEKFYRTMPRMNLEILTKRRRSSIDEISLPSSYTPPLVYTGDDVDFYNSCDRVNRSRSVSCDDYFFRCFQ